jgi:hypothetical protein
MALDDFNPGWAGLNSLLRVVEYQLANADIEITRRERGGAQRTRAPLEM